ncbi:MAG: ABC transporter substrate-binding protein [Microgenomates group bacterium]
MDDDKINQPENQPANPPFETVPIEEVPPEVTEPVSQDIRPSEEPAFNNIPPYEGNKMKYFIIGGAVAVFILVFLFLFKFLSQNKKTMPITLTYWGLWEEEQVFKPLIEEYKKRNPNIAINYQKMDPENYREKLITRSKNNQGPDIFRFHNTWLPQLKEVVSPLPNSVMSNSEFEKTFYKIHQKDLKVGNYYYGIPLEIDGLVLVYNDDLFKKAGIEKAPVTWEDITEILPRLTVKDANGNLITAGIAIGTAANLEHFSDIFALFLVQNGGNLKSLDKPEAAEALEIFRKFAEKPNNYWDETMPNSVNAFIQEKVAMIIVPSWEILVIKSANQEINLKVTAVPVIPGSTPISIANYWVEGVNKFSRHQLEAWKFLRFLVEKENLTKLYEIQSKMRLFGEPYSRVDLANLLTTNEYLKPVITQADYYVSVPLISRTFDNGLNDELIKYIENAINSTVSGVSYSEALKTAKQGVDQLLEKYSF